LAKPILFKELILREDDHFIVINKPYGVPTLDDRDQTVKGILRLAKEYSADAQVCHRLDKETSGILVIAKNPEAYRHMSMQFEHREVNKVYHALVTGLADLKETEIDMPLHATNTGVVHIDREKGKEAQTIFNTLEVFKKHTLVQCEPVTGRMHQIRVHLAYLKFPIVADHLYGGQDVYLSQLKKKFNLKTETDELPLIRRVALHAFSIGFFHLDGTPVYTEAPYPKDMEALLKQLRKTVLK
jgi:23S rRNA pseudouridine955/2504/2580 synthase